MKFIEFLFDFAWQERLFDLYYYQNNSSSKEDTTMTTFGLIITLLGAGSIAANILRLIDCIDKPAPRRRRMA